VISIGKETGRICAPFFCPDIAAALLQSRPGAEVAVSAMIAFKAVN